MGQWIKDRMQDHGIRRSATKIGYSGQTAGNRRENRADNNRESRRRRERPVRPWLPPAPRHCAAAFPWRAGGRTFGSAVLTGRIASRGLTAADKLGLLD